MHDTHDSLAFIFILKRKYHKSVKFSLSTHVNGSLELYCGHETSMQHRSDSMQSTKNHDRPKSAASWLKHLHCTLVQQCQVKAT